MSESPPPITITTRAEQGGFFEATCGRISGLAGNERAACNFVARRYFGGDGFTLTQTGPREWRAAAATEATLF